MSSDDNRLSIWDFSVEVDDNTEQVEGIPPQMMFLHAGQRHIKELKFHPYFKDMVLTTAQDTYNIFKPNYAEEDEAIPEESDESDGEKEIREANKVAKQLNKMKIQDDEEDDEED